MISDSLVAETLDRLGQILGARWIALACKGHEGEWQRRLGGRDPVLPQVEARFFRELEACGASADANPERWAAFLKRWKASDGRYFRFNAAPGCPAYYALLAPAVTDGTPPWPAGEWIDVVFQLLAAAAVERERSLREIPQRQAVLESAFDLILATGEEELIPRWLGLARRITGAQGAAYFQKTDHDIEARYIHATGELHGALAQFGAPLQRLLHATLDGEVQPPRVVHADLLGAAEESLPWHQAVILPFAMESAPGALLFLFTQKAGPRELDLHTATVFSRALKSRLEFLRLVASLQDANRELAASQARVAETVRLEALGEIAAGVAHDVNNVLGALLGRVQLLQYAQADPVARVGLAKMEALIGDGEAIVRRLQEAARIETRVAANPKTLDQLVREVYINCEFALRQKAQIHDRRQAWQTDFRPAGPLPGAPGRLEGALRALLTALPERLPAAAQIQIGTDRSEQTGRMSVQAAWSEGEGAPGLAHMPALTLLRSVVEDLDGRLDVNQTASGLTIRLSFATPKPEPQAVSAAPAAPAGSHVLVVDDDDAVREVLEELLRTGGHRVTVAKDGAEALGLLKEGTFDVVFTDLGMPGISGWELASAIKQESPELPVVLVTGWGAQLEPERLENSGVDRVLAKPFQWMAVLDAIQSLVGDGSPKAGA